MLEQVRNGDVQRSTIERKLSDFVERMDSEQALEHSMQNKEGLSETMHLVPTGPVHKFAPTVRHPTCAFRLLDTLCAGGFLPPGDVK